MSPEPEPTRKSIRRRLKKGTRQVPAAAGSWTLRFAATLSTPGVLLATLFFAGSLTPSLLPRTFLMQGVLSGVSIAIGYGIGVFARWLWGYLELPVPGPRAHRALVFSAGGACLVVAGLFLWQAAGWQDSVRAIMGTEPVGSAHPFRVGAIAVLVASLLLALARAFHLVLRALTHRLGEHFPRRIATVIGVLLAVTAFWSTIDGVLFQRALRAMDASFREVDARVSPELAAPTDPLRPGSAQSLLAWDELGHRGREFVASGPTVDELRAFLPPGGDADEVLSPIRVYVGLNSAETVRDRAALALAELRRVGAFERSVLVIATPTGTGWLDPSGMDALEYLHRGDVATVAVQYSYLPSWLAMLVEPEYGAETARAVFTEVYGHWSELPPDNRPRLYLYGLSLGALNSERSADLFDVIADPFMGALWVGPPFRSESWRERTEERAPDSPAWLPRFRDGSVIRFSNQWDGPDIPGVGWGPLRIVYLQYASDPITFFAPETLWQRPEWMEEPRAPDVSPDFRWLPVITTLQLAVDLAVGHNAPLGYGHVYAPEHYVDAWVQVTDPPGWTEPEIERLQGVLRERREAQLAGRE